MTTNIDSTPDVSDSPDWTTQRSEATISFALKGKTVIKPKISIVEGWNGSQVQPWRSATEADAWTMRYNPLNISNTVNKKNPKLPYNYSYLQQQSLDKFNITVKESAFKSIGINNVRDTEVTAAASNFQEDDHTLHCRYGAFPVISEEQDAFLCSMGEDYFCPDNPFGAKACPLYMRQQSCDSALYPSWIGDGESDHCTAWAAFATKFDSKSKIFPMVCDGMHYFSVHHMTGLLTIGVSIVLVLVVNCLIPSFKLTLMSLQRFVQELRLSTQGLQWTRLEYLVAADAVYHQVFESYQGQVHSHSRNSRNRDWSADFVPKPRQPRHRTSAILRALSSAL
jgi:hypothetical protein